MAQTRTIASAPPGRGGKASAAPAKKAVAKATKKAPAKSAPKPASKAVSVAPARSITPDHREAITRGRAENRAVSEYLEAIEGVRVKRGRPRSPESIRSKLEKLGNALVTARGVERLTSLQEVADLQRELSELEAGQQLKDLEAAFITYAKSYGERKGISYTTWRQFGVPADVLASAGIAR